MTCDYQPEKNEDSRHDEKGDLPRMSLNQIQGKQPDIFINVFQSTKYFVREVLVRFHGIITT